MKLIAVESPYGAKDNITIMRNIMYLRACMHYVHQQGHAPYASHALSTQPGVLDDQSKEERKQGMDGGKAWSEKADEVWFFCDLGHSRGMEAGLERAIKAGQVVEKIYLGEDWRKYLAPPKSDDKAWEWSCHPSKQGGVQKGDTLACGACGILFTATHRGAKYCSIACSSKVQEKTTWPSDEELKKLVWKYPSTHIAKSLGVTDRAVGLRCKKRGISKPPKGYWNQKYAGKL